VCQVFLEFTLSKDGTPGYTIPSTIYNEVLELYLAPHGDLSLLLDDAQRLLPNEDAAKQAAIFRLREEKAMGLLQDTKAKTNSYDVDHALFICQINDFKPGKLFLYEKNKLYMELLFHHMEEKAYAEIMKVCKQFGDKEPNLWIHALSYFAKQDADVTREIVEILHNIEKNELLPPLVVVQILCEHSTATVAVVKEYLIRQLRRERQMADEDQKLISKYRKEINTMQSEIEEINTSARIFQCVKCDACSAPLDLPAHHFLCMHSFHHRCLGENDRICPLTVLVTSCSCN